MGWEEDLERIEAEEATRIGGGDEVAGRAEIRRRELELAERRLLAIAATADWEAAIEQDRRTCDPRDIRLIDAGYEEVEPGRWRRPGDGSDELVSADEAHRDLAGTWQRIEKAAISGTGYARRLVLRPTRVVPRPRAVARPRERRGTRRRLTRAGPNSDDPPSDLPPLARLLRRLLARLGARR